MKAISDSLNYSVRLDLSTGTLSTLYPLLSSFVVHLTPDELATISTLHVPRGNRYSRILPGESYIGIRTLAD